MKDASNKHLTPKERIAQLVLDNVLDGIITIDSHGIMESFNPAAEKIFGYTASEAIGNNVNLLMPEPYHSSHDQYIHNYLSTGHAKIIGIGREVVGKRKDNTLFPMDLAVTKFMINDETHFVGIIQDITHRKETENALKEALQNNFKTTVKNLENIVFKYQKNKHNKFIFTLSEGKLGRQLGLVTDNVQGKTLQEVFPQKLAQQLEEHFTQAMNGEALNYVMVYKNRSIHVSLSPIFEKGKVTEVVGSGTDITYLKKIEKELSLARDKALEASELKSEFLANMSHEIRTPMNGILGVTDMLLDTNLEEKQQEYVNLINQSAHALLTIINDILDFSKMEAGKLKIDQIDYNLPETVEGIAEILLSKAHSKGLTLLTYIDPFIPKIVKGDPMRLRQVLLNLTDNAIKFTSKGNVVIRANLNEKSDNKVTVYFTVVDTGIGISDDEKQRLFQPFVQADGSTTRKYGGTGLGLAISKRLVELMGGEMGLESTKGEGTTFWFTVPLRAGDEEVSPDIINFNQNLESLNVLVANDSQTESAILEQYLDSWRIHNETVDNGIDALTLIKKRASESNPFDIAIVNIDDPGIDSFALANVLQKDPALSSTKLIYLSGIEEKSYKEKALKSGYTTVINQPIKQSQLLDCIVTLRNEKYSNSSVELNKSKQKNTPSKSKKTRTMANSKARLLLVEDNPVNRKVATYQLEKLGYYVDTAENGKVALNKLENNHYAAIFMDIQMPEMDGMAATERIRSMPQPISTTPIIAMTANAMETDKRRYLSIGMDDYLSKPVNLNELKSILNKWVEDKQQDNHKTPIDLQKITDTYGEDPAMIKEFLGTFIETTPEFLKKLEEALAREDASMVKEYAHGLKGSAFVVEAQDFASLSERIEKNALASDWKELSVLYDQLKVSFKEIKEYLEKEL